MANQALKTNSGVTVQADGAIILDDRRFRSCNQFLKDLRESHGINLELRDKSSSKLMCAAGWLFSTIKVNDKFMTNFFTIIGTKIYAPVPILEGMTDARLLQVLMHETIHAFDRAKLGNVLFSAAYLFPQTLALLAPFGVMMAAVSRNTSWLWLLLTLLFLAPIPAPFRMWLELRANRSDVSFAKKVTYNNRTGEELPTNYISWLVDRYCNGEYYFMWPFRSHVTKLMATKPDINDKAYLFVAKWIVIHKAATGLDVSISFYKQ